MHCAAVPVPIEHRGLAGSGVHPPMARAAKRFAQSLIHRVGGKTSSIVVQRRWNLHMGSVLVSSITEPPALRCCSCQPVSARANRRYKGLL